MTGFYLRILYGFKYMYITYEFEMQSSYSGPDYITNVSLERLNFYKRNAFNSVALKIKLLLM